MSPDQRRAFALMEEALREAHMVLTRSGACYHMVHTMGAIEHALAAAEAVRMAEAVATLRESGWTE